MSLGVPWYRDAPRQPRPRQDEPCCRKNPISGPERPDISGANGYHNKSVGGGQRRRINLDEVPSPVALGREITRILRCLAAESTLLRHDLEPRVSQGRYLIGIVGEDADTLDPELAQHHGREVEPATVGIEPKPLVGIVGVVAMRLQLVGTDLVADAIPTPLLVEVQEDAAIFGHPLYTVAQLVAAVASQAAE